MNAGTRAALTVAHEVALSDDMIEWADGPVGLIRMGRSGAVQRATIGHDRIHDPRRTAAVTMLSNAIPLQKVSQAMGHPNTSVTFSNYGRNLPEHMQDAVYVQNCLPPQTGR